jgi:hypothetical protein
VTEPSEGRTLGRVLAKPPSRADAFRKRAHTLDVSLKSRRKHERLPLLKKQKALRDLAGNEDWLEGEADKQRPKKLLAFVAR